MQESSNMVSVFSDLSLFKYSYQQSEMCKTWIPAAWEGEVGACLAPPLSSLSLPASSFPSPFPLREERRIGGWSPYISAPPLVYLLSPCPAPQDLSTQLALEHQGICHTAGPHQGWIPAAYLFKDGEVTGFSFCHD